MGLSRTAILAMNRHRHDSRMGRRRFLQLAGAGLSLTLLRRRARATSYPVGVGHEADPYAATVRAIHASGDWSAPEIAGRHVVIKPNLVAAMAADTGATTDPQVVRAIVDLALAAGAAHVTIVEGAPGARNFAICGYDFFRTYDPEGRVSLVDLDDQPLVLAPVPDGLAYRQIYMPGMLLEDRVFFVSAAKMKCHAESLVTLAMKNLFGPYELAGKEGRFAMHDRGMHQAVVDLNLVRPVDFAVVDGVWAMEGYGPWGGSPVRMDLVMAGSNALAVDRVCLMAMGIPQSWVQHLAYAAAKGLGPADLTSVEVKGDSLTPEVFARPDIPPIVDRPRVTPARFRPEAGQQVTITYWVNRRCWTQVEIVFTQETSPEVTRVRLLRDWAIRLAGTDVLAWDGQDNQGRMVPPGSYTVRVQATHGELVRNAFATSWLEVVREGPRHVSYLPFILR